MYQKLIRKIIIGLFLTISSHVFGITFGDLSPLQKQIHALLFKIARNETKNDKNHFAVALEIVTNAGERDDTKKTYVFLLKSMSDDISFISGGSQEVANNRIRVHHELYGNPCKVHNVRNIGSDCSKKGLVDSEFACIAFLENNEKDVISGEKNKEYIAKFINDKIKEDKVTKISLHGFTTRDTCSACFQHLISYCENANREFRSEKGFKIKYKEITWENKEITWENIGSTSENIETFWKSLKDTLGGKVGNLSVPVDFYISSRIYYGESSQLVRYIVDEENSEKNPMKMLVLRKEFVKEYPDDLNKRSSVFSNFIKNNTEDLAQGFCSYLNEPKRCCLDKIISDVERKKPGVIDISDQINK